MHRKIPFFCLLLLLLPSACLRAHASASLLLEEPFGAFGALNPTGHAAIYLDRVCAETPTLLRRCGPGESGAVISRYHRVSGYDWLAIPLLPYLYAVQYASDVPHYADAKLEARLRNRYREAHLLAYVPDQPGVEMPGGEWTQLIGASYDRKIYGYELDTTPEQDNRFIQTFNSAHNSAHFNLLFRNCANFSANVIDFYFPRSVRRNFLVDAGIMTPKQVAYRFVRYGRRHQALHPKTFVIPQVPGTIRRSRNVNGVIESLIKTKPYVLPLALLHPYFTGTLVAAYFGDRRFQPDSTARVFDPALPPAAVLAEQTAPLPAAQDGWLSETTDTQASSGESE